MGELGKGQKPNSVSHSTQAVSRSSPAKEDKDILSQLPSKTQRGELQPQNSSSVFFVWILSVSQRKEATRQAGRLLLCPPASNDYTLMFLS